MRYAYRPTRELHYIEFARSCRPDKASRRIRHEQSALCQQFESPPAEAGEPLVKRFYVRWSVRPKKRIFIGLSKGFD